MLTTFDRYLLRRYITSFVILFVSTYGLFVVIDGFSNVDGFQDHAESSWDLISRMGQYYAYQSCDFFEMVGSTLCVISAVVVLALLQYQRELHPILAAGIPTYRLALPLVLGALVINGLLILNTEFLVPNFALQLQSSRSGGIVSAKTAEPAQDFDLRINISGEALVAATQTMQEGRFILQAPTLVEELTTLTCHNAIYYPESDKHPSGWVLKEVNLPYQSLEHKLTELGRRKIFRLKDARDLFLATEVTFQQIYSNGGSYLYDSTAQLIRRINSPALSQASINRQIQHLHNRLARPVQNLVAVLIAIPFVLRRESRSLITNMAVCAGVLVFLMGFLQVCSYLAGSNYITPDFAAWAPVLVGGGMAAWFSTEVQT